MDGIEDQGGGHWPEMLEGAARVRRTLVDVLREGGLQAPGVGGDGWWDGAARYLARRLWHLGEGELAGVAEWARRAAVPATGRKGAAGRLVVPDLARLVQVGERLAGVAAPSDPLVVSWLQSRGGEEAEAGGAVHLVAVMRALGAVSRRGIQPGSPYWRAEVEQDRVRLAGALAAGGDRAAFDADLRLARALVAEGRARRALAAAEAGEVAA